MAKIVLSYRRSDTKWITGHLYERLRDHFGDGNVFMDVDNMPIGRDFRKHLRRVLDNCEVLIAIVGPRWLEDESGNRALDAAADWVRMEISEALGRDIPVVPLLIDGTKMPKVEQLPQDLRDFAFMHAATFDTEDFRNQIARFTKQLEKLFRDIEATKSSLKPSGESPSKSDELEIAPQENLAHLPTLGIINVETAKVEQKEASKEQTAVVEFASNVATGVMDPIPDSAASRADASISILQEIVAPPPELPLREGHALSPQPPEPPKVVPRRPAPLRDRKSASASGPSTPLATAADTILPLPWPDSRKISAPEQPSEQSVAKAPIAETPEVEQPNAPQTKRGYDPRLGNVSQSTELTPAQRRVSIIVGVCFAAFILFVVMYGSLNYEAIWPRVR